jgi:ankyrin repeat protein
MERINSQVKDQEELAKQVLWWITCAKRPLITSELQHALAVEIGESQLDEDNLPQVEDIISVCAGLATVDEESNIIRLAHYTTQEYFERTQSRWFPNANGDIARVCLTYLSFDTFNSGFCSTDVEFEERLRFNALYNYSARYWGYHFRSASSKPEQLALGFLQSQEKLSAASQAMRVIKLSSNDACYSQQVPKQISGVHLAAYFGLKKAILTLVELLHDPNVRDTDGQTPLWWAAVNGNEEEVKLLLVIGVVHPSSKDCYDRTPLTLAAMNGHEKVVKLLLATGRVDPEPKDSYGRTPLWWAAANGHEGVVKLLLGTGRVEPEPKDGHGRVPSWLTLSRRIQFAEDYGKMALASASESRATAWRRLAPSRVSEAHLVGWGVVYMPVEYPVDLVLRTSSLVTWIRSTVNLEHDAVIKLLLGLALALALAPPLLALALALAPPLAHHDPLYTEAR